MRRCGCLFALWVITACGSPPHGPSGQPVDDRSTAFGTKVIDVAFAFDDAARQSLVAAPGTDVRATMTFKDGGGAAQSDEVTLHIKGQRGSSRPLDDKPAFKVNLGKRGHFFGLEHLTLNNMVQDSTMLHEALGYAVYDAAGVSVPATGYARLTVNGQAYGLYLNLESPDTQFLTRRFGDDTGVLYEGSYGVDLRAGDVEKFELHEGTDPGRALLRDFVRAIDAPGDAVFYGATPKVDTASFLGMVAAEALLGDWDNYYVANNYRIYWNPVTSRWHFIPTGLDEIFASSIGVFEATGLLFQKCLASERCTQDYALKVRDVASRFASLDLLVRMDALIAVIDTAVRADPKRTYDLKTIATEREKMRAFISRRPAEALAALSCLDGGREVRTGACAGAMAANVGTHDCLDAGEGVVPNGSPVGASDCRGLVDQRWHLTPRGVDFSFVAVRGGKCLEVGGGSADEDAPLHQSDCARSDGQIFALRPSQTGTQLVARQSGKCLAIAPGSPAGAAVIQVACADDPAQKWRVTWSIYQ